MHLTDRCSSKATSLHRNISPIPTSGENFTRYFMIQAIETIYAKLDCRFEGGLHNQFNSGSSLNQEPQPTSRLFDVDVRAWKKLNASCPTPLM